MQSIHHRRNLPKTYETKRNRIGDEKREIRKKKLSGELNLHGDLHLSRARRQSQLSLADEDAVSRQRDGSLSLSEENNEVREKKRKEKERENYLSPARRQAGSLPPASPLPPAGEPPLSRRGKMSLSLSLDGENNEREKKKKRENERARARRQRGESDK